MLIQSLLESETIPVPFPEVATTNNQQSFFKDEYFFTVTSEKSKSAEIKSASFDTLIKNPASLLKDAANLYNYETKTVVIRYGQTFAN